MSDALVKLIEGWLADQDAPKKSLAGKGKEIEDDSDD
jgi:hypothetical protein